MFENFKSKFPIEADKWDEYVGYFKQMKVPAKTVLLKEGDISRRAFIVEKGCLRAWFHHNGKDITFQFFFELNTVASIESFRKNIPSPVSIEAIEPSIVWWIDKKDLDSIIAEINLIPPLRDKFIDAMFERTFEYMRHFFSSIKDTPQQRYLNLIENNPQIVKRVAQHYIASYLGITTVHLSRIKSKLAKEKTSGI